MTAIASRNSPEALDEISTVLFFFPPLLPLVAAGNERESPVNFRSGSQRAIYKHQEYNVTDKQ